MESLKMVCRGWQTDDQKQVGSFERKNVQIGHHQMVQHSWKMEVLQMAYL